MGVGSGGGGGVCCCGRRGVGRGCATRCMGLGLILGSGG